ncbi:MAG TPA: valine--tRNA ligase [Firmicutes bacterium]|jgi:valyl-tRNA synthetase|nr:valine--tRNA ligase [Bacillota bacterium]
MANEEKTAQDVNRPTDGVAPGADLPKVYDPKTVESKWYQRWEEEGYFHAVARPGNRRFSVVIPPPNVTGALHMGHALNITLQDILVRWRRMQGYDTLWVPGTDHAGIATQIKVEENLRKTQEKTRHDLGRERFLELVWEWKDHYHANITKQIRQIGASVDWRRERFTLDEGCSHAVRTVFVDLYERGLIYQGSYIVNWCPHCHTTLSDLEVEHEDETGKLWHLQYPFADGSGYAVVATTRPETMLGDTAVAVNPDDERYGHLVGKTVILPLLNREIPIIADEYVDPTFGTGMVKVTPAHDPNDFEMGLRHNLAQIRVIGEDGTMTAEAGPYAGLERYTCRARVVEDLQKQGLLLRIDDHDHAVGHCYRCHNVVEPLVSKQWFVRMKPLAEPAIEAVRNGSIRFVPDRFAKNYMHWMNNIRDWCISRQLWWGHRIPVWTCLECQHQFAAKVDPTTCSKCGSQQLEQDPDVLDTWFSSALWPFSTLGWPERTDDLRDFYPTSVLVTAYDIIYFWVARMIFSGLEHTGRKPFHDVLVHGLVRDALGRKMSKSLGNGVDPLEVIAECGADALRFTLATGVAPGNDTRYHPERAEANRNFVNKVWNASRFALMNLKDYTPPADGLAGLQLELMDRWVLSRYAATAHEVTRHLERYDFGEAARALYDFIWSELCDWYIEMAKPRLYGHHGAERRWCAQTVLSYVLTHTMELLHPFMPFVTEEIWQHLPHTEPSITVAAWPTPDSALIDEQAVADMTLVMEVVRAIRNVRSEKTVPPDRAIQAIVHAESARRRILQEDESIIISLARLSELTLTDVSAPKPDRAIAVVAGGVEVYIPLAGMVDLQEELERIRKELAETQGHLQRTRDRLANPSFVDRAPAKVVEGARQQLQALEEKERKLSERMKELK